MIEKGEDKYLSRRDKKESSRVAVCVRTYIRTYEARRGGEVGGEVRERSSHRRRRRST